MRTLAGVLGLVLSVVATRGRLRGRYWAWRQQTAFGPGRALSRAERRRIMLDYGRWVVRMRRLG